MDQTSYFHWGFILISVPNLVLIAVMLVLFIAALLLPFSFHKDGPKGTGNDRS